jgi:5-methylcytosine-specific restriction endonuclease McrA
MRNKKQLRPKADKVWYLALLKPRCEVCGGKANQVHHFFYKSQYGHLRYHPENGISLCQACHFVLHTKDPKIITDKIIEARGKRWYNRLKKEALKRPQSYQTISFYKEAIKKYGGN